jgi:hypothetical protein
MIESSIERKNIKVKGTCKVQIEGNRPEKQFFHEYLKDPRAYEGLNPAPLRSHFTPSDFGRFFEKKCFQVLLLF